MLLHKPGKLVDVGIQVPLTSLIAIQIQLDHCSATKYNTFFLTNLRQTSADRPISSSYNTLHVDVCVREVERDSYLLAAIPGLCNIVLISNVGVISSSTIS